MNNENCEHFCAYHALYLSLLPYHPKSQSLAELLALKWGRVEVCRYLLHAHLATHCPRRRGSPGIIRVGWVLRLFLWGWGALGSAAPA